MVCGTESMERLLRTEEWKDLVWSQKPEGYWRAVVNWMQPALVISGFGQLYHVSLASSAFPILSSSK